VGGTGDGAGAATVSDAAGPETVEDEAAEDGPQDPGPGPKEDTDQCACYLISTSRFDFCFSQEFISRNLYINACMSRFLLLTSCVCVT
jgi:hypothetical protein